MTPNVELLPVPNGYKMFIQHVHDPEELKTWAMALHGEKHASPPRYVTMARLVNKETGEIEWCEVAACSPKDSPSRKLGRAIAHNRTIAHWNKYGRDWMDVVNSEG